MIGGCQRPPREMAAMKMKIVVFDGLVNDRYITLDELPEHTMGYVMLETVHFAVSVIDTDRVHQEIDTSDSVTCWFINFLFRYISVIH